MARDPLGSRAHELRSALQIRIAQAPPESADNQPANRAAVAYCTYDRKPDADIDAKDGEQFKDVPNS
ncbi:hypothetical protein [Bradyrhizobium sp. USDA 3315]